MKQPNIITMCGSTRFKNEYLESTKWLTLTNNIIISVGLFGHSDGDNLTIDEKTMLDNLHFRKIDLCNEIFIIDVDGYIGNSTKNEIEYATKNGKNIRYLSKEIDSLEKWKNEYYNRKNLEEWNK